MKVAERLGPEVQAELELFLTELRQSAAVAAWLEKPAFKEMYEKYEHNARNALSKALVGSAELEGKHPFEDVYSRQLRDGMLEASIQTVFITCKELMGIASETMVSSFAGILTRAGLH